MDSLAFSRLALVIKIKTIKWHLKASTLNKNKQKSALGIIITVYGKQTALSMEWSREKTMKLIELLQGNASLWNPSLCQTRRDKQKRRSELRCIADVLDMHVADVTRKIQHLRTQYNREWIREIRVNTESPDDPYVSNWYAFEYLHFLKDSTKPYRVLEAEEDNIVAEQNTQAASLNSTKHRMSPPHKIPRTDHCNSIKSEEVTCIKDDLSLFGEYIANELRSIKGEKNLLIAKKKILDVIFEVKLVNTCNPRPDTTVCTVYSHAVHNNKEFTTSDISAPQIEPLSSHATSSTGVSDIINSSCNYST